MFFKILYLSVLQLFFYRIVFTLLADPWESPATTESGPGHVRETNCL